LAPIVSETLSMTFVVPKVLLTLMISVVAT
jgi:hypothetical protein